MVTRFCAFIAFILLFAAGNAAAQLSIPSGGSFTLEGGSLDLAGTNLSVAGTFAVGAGNVYNAANVEIAANGLLDGGSGALNLFGDWSKLGTFAAGSGQVNFFDGAASQSQISGNTTFANLAFATTLGKSYVFATGSTQTITALLQILGTPAQPIQFRSAAAGQVANLNLLAGGSQNIAHVGVSNVHANGQHLAPTLTNEGGTGDALGWFAAVIVQNAVPATALSLPGMLLLALALLAMVWHSRRHRFES